MQLLKQKLEEQRAQLASVLLSLTFYDLTEGNSLQDQLRQHAHLKGQFDKVTEIYNDLFPPTESTDSEDSNS